MMLRNRYFKACMAVLAVMLTMTGCSNDDNLSAEQSDVKSMTMMFVGGVTPFDADAAATTRAGSWTWKNGDVLFLQLFNGTLRTAATAVYNGGAFSVSLPGSSNLGSDGNCTVYYFDTADAKAGQASVKLGPNVGVYSCTTGKYTATANELTITAQLSPTTGRLKFVAPKSGSAGDFKVDGILVNTAYDVAENKFQTSNTSISMSSRAGEYPYIYGVFSTSLRELKITDANRTEFTRYFRSTRSNVLREGVSGTLTVPTETSYANWTMQMNADPESVEKFTANGVEFKMVKVKGGTFDMGATREIDSEAQSDESANGKTHKVTLSDFSIGQTEVTQELWEAVMAGTWENPSKYKYSKHLPVHNVSKDVDCKLFINKLNKLLEGQLGGRVFRLPTEAEWEYAAKGGSASRGFKYSGSGDADAVAFYNQPTNTGPQEVAKLQANELGLYDMSGNVWEWCSDLYGSYPTAPQTNPTGPASSSMGFVRRGGSWCDRASLCRVTKREYHQSDMSDEDKNTGNQGLRLVLTGAGSQQGGGGSNADKAPAGAVAVDLGLPSGTKWANMNVGASKPEDYGDYFAWGETKPKAVCDWSTYIHCDGSGYTCHDLGDDISGDSRYDAARANWGGQWRMPTEDEIQELLDNCTSEWTQQNGVNGCKFSSKKNGNSIFLPAAGNRYYASLLDQSTYGYYWSASVCPSDSYEARLLYFNSGYAYWYYYSRNGGRSVRPVLRN